MNIELSGRGAVVTGAGSGMGRSIALSLASAAMNVVIADVDLGAAQRVQAEAQALGVRSIAVRTDVSQFEQVDALAEVAFAEFGDIAVLANNAGVNWRPFRASWDASIDDFTWIMNVNFWGVFNGHRAFVPRMRQTEGAKHIVNTCSVASLLPAVGHSAYGAAKGAVDAFTAAVRAEYEIAGLPIAVSTLYPSRVKTNISSSERLRPVSEQSTTRDVIPWEAYAGPAETTGAENLDTATDQSQVTSHLQAIDPDWVGPMVVDAIIHNRPYILTHPFDQPIQERAAELLRSYNPVVRPVAAPTKTTSP